MKVLTDWVLAHEPEFRLAAFGSVFLLIALWELAAARRPLIRPKIRRWSANLLIVVINTVVLRLAIPVAALGMAGIAAERGWGLLHWIELPSEVALVVGNRHKCLSQQDPN